MSAPPPCTVQVEPFSAWVPPGVAPPTSAQLHPTGHVGAPAATAIESNVTALAAAALCDVTASPASIAPLTLSVTVEPGTAVHVVPFADVYAVNVLPDRATRRNTGAVPARP